MSSSYDVCFLVDFLGSRCYLFLRIRYSRVLSLFDSLFSVYRILSRITGNLDIVSLTIHSLVCLVDLQSINKLLEVQRTSYVLRDLQRLLTGPVRRNQGTTVGLNFDNRH